MEKFYNLQGYLLKTYVFNKHSQVGNITDQIMKFNRFGLHGIS